MDYIFSNYHFLQLWKPLYLIYSIIAIGVYFWAVKKFAFSVSSKKKTAFVSGVLLFYLAVGSPIHILGHAYLFSAHMLEQALVYFIAIPLLVLGLPGQIIEIGKNYQLINKGLKIFANPIVASLLFNLLFSVYHVPMIFDYLNTQHTLLHVFHYMLTVTSFLMWLSIFHAPHTNNELSDLKKLGYIILNSVLITPVCALIIFANKAVYTTYLDAPQLFDMLPTQQDQQLGGIVMKIVQEGVFIFLIAVIFFRWVNRERNNDDAKSLSDIPAEKVI